MFTGERSAHSYRLNKMAMSFTAPENRERFKADEEGFMREQGMSDIETDLVRRRDWKGMMEYGASIYLVIKIGGVTGHALRRAVESFPKDKRVVVFGTGGLTHQLHGTQFGTKNAAWDNEFMDLLESDPEQLAALSLNEYMERGGTEGVEMIMWLAMRAALGPTVKRVHRNYTAPMNTGYGLLALAS